MSRQEALVTPSVMRWSRERARLTVQQAANSIERSVEEIEAWEKGSKRPSMAQARRASEVYKRSLAVFYLPEPPKDFDTLKDFRQLPNTESQDYSPELALIIRQLLSRQEWMRDYLIRQGTAPLEFIGSANVSHSPSELAKSIRSTLDATVRKQFSCYDARESLNFWVAVIEASGGYVCREGKVQLEEARGIALTDEYAPFIYVNSNDSYAGRQFTLIHELVHLWINEPGLSNLVGIGKSPHSPDAATEAFCNKTAARVLVPSKEFRAIWSGRDKDGAIEDQIEAVAKQFNVSDETIARCLLDRNVIPQPEYERLRAFYRRRWEEYKGRKQSGGGNYYKNTVSFNGQSFTRTVLNARYSGAITIREACLTLGVKANNLRKLAETARLLPARKEGGDR